MPHLKARIVSKKCCCVPFDAPDIEQNRIRINKFLWTPWNVCDVFRLCILLLAINQSSFLFVAQRFDFSFSLHSLTAAVELLQVYHLLSFTHSCISRALTLFVLLNPVFQILGVSSVVATIFAEKDVNIVRHPLSTHSYHEQTLLFQ